MRIGIIGAGRMGGAMGLAMKRAGHRVTGVTDLLPERAGNLARELGADPLPPGLVVDGSDVILLSVPDDRIAGAAAELAVEVTGMRGKTFFHLSGAHPAALLDPLRITGSIGSLHPLLSVAEPGMGAQLLGSCYYALEGEPSAVSLGRSLVHDLGGRVITLAPDDKVRYHTAAVMASNLLLGLIDAVLGLYGQLGLARADAYEAVWPLIEATLANARVLGPEAALTGPVSRGDVGTIQGHLSALTGGDRLTYDIYQVLSRATVALALRGGRIDGDQARAFEAVLEPKRPVT